MTAMTPSEKIAFELFTEVHNRLGRTYTSAQQADDYFHRPEVKAMWTEVARLLDEPVESDDDCIEDYAYTLFAHVHRRLGDMPESSLTEEAFGRLPVMEMAWREIARSIVRRRPDPGIVEEA